MEFTGLEYYIKSELASGKFFGFEVSEAKSILTKIWPNLSKETQEKYQNMQIEAKLKQIRVPYAVIFFVFNKKISDIEHLDDDIFIEYETNKKMIRNFDLITKIALDKYKKMKK